MRTEILSLSTAAAIAATPAWAGMMERGAGVSAERSHCRIIEEAARTNRLPVSLLTRLLWTESHFQADALSPKGARGIAQFMPATADERGLSNPFDPAEAIPQAARLVADLDRRFENSGLAIAAYNAGSKRVSDWLTNTEALPKETQNYVLAVTGHSLEEWGAIRGYRLPVEAQSCLALSTSLASHPFKRLPLIQSSYSA
jgi:soluble lytic murein transglycosylase-like protein